MTMYTAKEMRELAGPSDEEQVCSALEYAMETIYKAAKKGEHCKASVSVIGDDNISEDWKDFSDF